MSSDLEKMATCIYDNFVPLLWCNEGEGKGFLSMKPLASWIVDCNDRIKFLTDWFDSGTPDVFWISGFFFPQAFFTGSQQNFARKHTIAVDQISFSFIIKSHMSYKDVREKPEAGVYTYGVYLEGCKWDYEQE